MLKVLFGTISVNIEFSFLKVITEDQKTRECSRFISLNGDIDEISFVIILSFGRHCVGFTCYQFT